MTFGDRWMTTWRIFFVCFRMFWMTKPKETVISEGCFLSIGCISHKAAQPKDFSKINQMRGLNSRNIYIYIYIWYPPPKVYHFHGQSGYYIYILYKSFWRLRDPTKTDDPKQAMFYAFRISVYFRQMEMVGGKPGICWASIFQENGGKKKEVGVKRPWVSNCPTFFLRGEYYCVFKKKRTSFLVLTFFWKISVFFIFCWM